MGSPVCYLLSYRDFCVLPAILWGPQCVTCYPIGSPVDYQTSYKLLLLILSSSSASSTMPYLILSTYDCFDRLCFCFRMALSQLSPVSGDSENTFLVQWPTLTSPSRGQLSAKMFDVSEWRWGDEEICPAVCAETREIAVFNSGEGWGYYTALLHWNAPAVGWGTAGIHSDACHEMMPVMCCVQVDSK